MTADAAFAVVFGALAAAAIVALIADALRSRAGLALAGILTLLAGAASLYHAWTAEPGLAYGTFRVGGGSSAAVGLVGVLGGLVLLSARDHADPKSGPGRGALIVLGAVGASCAAHAADVITLLIALEIAAAAGYALIASSRTRASAEASMKYLVQGAVVTGLLVLGAAVLMGAFSASGTYADIASSAREAPSAALTLPVLLVVASLAFKAGGAPFHSWAPDAYQTAPTGGAAFLAGPVKLAMVVALAAFVRFVGKTSPQDATDLLGALGVQVLLIVGGLAVLSVLVGSLVALRQRSYVRMLAYAGIAQLGYALIAVASQQPATAVMFTSTYAVATAGAFLAAQAFAEVRPGWDGTIEDLAGLGVKAPVLGVSVSLLMMSLAGIPPLIGFWGKLAAFQSAVSVAASLGASESPQVVAVGMWYAILAITGIVGSVISLGYYGSVLRALYARSDDSDRHHDTWGRGTVAVALVAIAAVVIGLLPLFLSFNTLVRGFLM